ncbi:PAS domain-containing sensor histidine kinase [Pseudosulfitobacter koreensis]|uniref:histidine kinase n=1 Tax=Pseudosulfitobacter koreensis TaxID=2968472 RepID=A0ABT1YVY3_9RHOB|nr:PAS domain-containing sensor histidine kinase [Pseudosulfitobacter koreense]MCR8825043.1 PAS domain-containing sensor histidine kinase [Pseudosulfitobacter koreense]
MPDSFEKYSLTWHVTPEVLGVLSINGKFENTNPAWYKVLGWRADEVESKHFLDLLHPDDVERTAQAFETIQTGRPIMGFENRYLHRDGSFRWLSWNCVPEGDRFFCSARDVTEDKRNRANLKNREEEARFREQFIAILGHDLRNPLAAINAATRMLQRREEDADKQQLMTGIQDSVARMSALINDMMDFARARLGNGINLATSSDVSLQKVLRHTLDEIQLAHPDTEFETHFDFADPVVADAMRIAQLASNLLSNAATHGDSSAPVHLHARDVGNDLVITVKNGGTPISTERLAGIFEPFSGSEPDSEQHGLGLGLYIANQIALAHGGRMQVQSDENGTVFTFTLPRG